MKACELIPVLHRLSLFTYRKDSTKYKKIDHEKTQYVYRFLWVAAGYLDVCLSGRVQRVGTGDLVYLTPGQTYRLIPQNSSFSLYSVFFDFENAPMPSTQPNATCIFLSEYKKELCSPPLTVEDAPCLKEGCILKGADFRHALESMHRMDKSSPFYRLYTSAQLRAMIAELAASTANSHTAPTVTEKIVSYVYANYDKNISARSVSDAFSYHPNYINTLIKQRSGKSLSHFIRQVKIEHATSLLSEASVCPVEIAQMLGYYDYSHFYKAFIAETGMTPTEFKKNRLCGK